MNRFFQYCLMASVLLLWNNSKLSAQAPIITVDTIIDAKCSVSDDGAIQISVAGVPSFSYSWSNGATTEDATGLIANTYFVTVTDGNGSVTVGGPYSVGAPPLLAVNVDSTATISCNGATDGAVFLLVGGGTPAYSYIWTSGETTQNATALGAGPQNVTVTDANGCSASSKAIFIPDVLAIDIVLDTIHDLSCNGANDGQVGITASGGVGGFTYLWSNGGATTEDLSSLAAGSYTVTVSDSNGCTAVSGPHVVNQPAILNFTLDSITHILCNADADGAIFMSTAGGTTPYSFVWSNTTTTEDLTGLSGGNYSATVTDANGCSTTTGPHTVNEPPLLIVNIDTIINNICGGATQGSVDISISGGTPNYSYIWTDGQTTEDATGLTHGAFNVTVTDANGCSASSKAIFLDSIPVLSIVLDTIIDVTCNGAADGAIQITATGGTGPLSYLWSNGGTTTDDLSGLSGGNYTVTVTDSVGCVAVSGLHTVNEPTLLVVTFDSLDHVSCNGASDGAVYVTVTGGTTNYSYLWDNGQTTEDATGLSGSTNNLTVTDANGCTASTGPHVVNEPTLITITLDSINDVSCNGGNDGGVFISVTGGVTNYSYLWSNGQTTEDATGLVAGTTYAATITDATGCTMTTGPHTINEPTLLVVTFDSLDHVSCNGAADGAVYVTVTGGTTNYSYLWDNGQTTEDATGLSGSTNNLTITDANGCTVSTGPHVVNEPTLLVVTFDSLDHVSCNGASDGAVYVTVTGGTTNYSYLWDNGQTTEDATGLSGSTNNLTVTDANGCTVSTGPHVVNEPTLITITLDSINDVSCNGGNDGGVFISVTGGVTNYSYLWSDGQTIEDATGLVAGTTYAATITDATGCTMTTGPHTVNEPTLLVVTFDSLDHVSCNGASDGAVYVTVTGGTTNYSYLWDNGQTTADATGLSGSTNNLTVTDANGCTVSTGSHTVNEPTLLVVTFDSLDHVSCNGASDGAVYVTVTGGTTNYSYLWDNGQTTADATGLSGSTNNLTVTDANGCTASTGPHVVNEPTLITITLDSINDVSCNGGNDGEVFISVTGGVTNYSYLWSDGQTTEDATGLVAGATYAATITDATGCTMTTGPHTINEPTLLVVTFDSLDHVSCNGAADGAVYVTVTGGTTSYSYLWNNGQTTADATGLSGSTNNLTVTDANGCTVSTGFHIVNEPTLLVVTFDSLDHVSCNGAADGAVYVTVTGGTTNYSYLWDNGQTTADATGLSGSTNNLTVTDANGCTASTGPHVVNEPTLITITLDSINDVSCNGGNDGGVFISVTGGVTNYSYLWSDGQTTEDATGLVAGTTYAATITDATGCTMTTGPHTVNEPTLLVVTFDSLDHVSCNGAADGAVYVTVTGGTTSYSYLWDNGQTTEDATGLSGSTNNLTVTDANGCTVSTGFHIVNEPTLLVVTFDSLDHVSCNGAADGAVYVTVTGGTTNYSYLWDNGQTTADATGLSGSTNNLTVTDANGCTASTGPHVVNEPTLITITLDSINDVSCNGGNDGGVFISVTGGVTNYSYLWSDGQTTEDATGLVAGTTYAATITDATGCTMTTGSHTINEPTLLVVTFDSLDHVSCNGASDGAVYVTVTGGTTNYSYLWNNGQTTADATGLSGSTNNLTVTDANGCTVSTGSHTVNEPTLLVVTFDSLDHVSCNGASDGAAYVTVTGGTTNYSYLWDNGQTTEDATGLSGSTNNLTVTDANGCTASTGPHVVNEPTLIVVNLDSINDVSCNGGNDGGVFISIAGGVTNYSYLWSDGQTTEDATGLVAGTTYAATITDATGCTMTTGPHTVNEPTLLVVTFDSLDHVSCNGAADGAVYVTVTGGTTNYSYLWDNGQTTADATGLSGSTNNLTVTDANGCTVSTGPHVVNEPTLLVATFDSLDHVSCNGAADGAVYVTVTGGTTNYSYLWDNGQTTEDATGLSGSTNNLTVTDANGCTVSTGPHVVNEPATLGITIDSFKNESCAGIVDGFVSISVTGGSTPYNYNWSNGATTQDINNLSAATYSIMVTDANGCMALDTQLINNVPTITASLDLLDSVSCKSLSDGQIGISVTGGAGSYGYNWSNSSTTEDLSGIAAGNYTVTITDVLGCSITGGAYTVSEPDSLVLSESLNNVSCNGAANGSIDITTVGGTLNYTYSWSPNTATTEDLSNLNGGTYNVTVSDQNGCMDSINTMVISEPSAITVTATSTDETCDGLNDGAINATVQGGKPAVGGYVYNWSNNATTEDLVNISGGTYTLTVSDSLGCVKTLDVNVYDPTALTLAISVSTPLEGCLGEAIGGMEATTNGGTGTLSYTWSNSVNTALNNGLNAGTYTVVVSDANGCTISADETIGAPLMPSVTPFVVQSGTTNTTVTWGDQVAIDAGNDQSASGVTYLWTETSAIGNLNIGSTTIPSTTIQPEPTTTSTYVLLVSATSTDGCVDTASISVVVEISDLLGMPNAFTPNDDGKNDRFRPVQLDPQFMTEFIIYNRWGQVMYNNAKVSDGGWDGRFNGKEQPRDGYIFILKYQLPEQDEKMLRGPFTLLR